MHHGSPSNADVDNSGTEYEPLIFFIRCRFAHVYYFLEKKAFPNDLDYFLCTNDEITRFGESCKEIGIQYVGICCGNSSRYFRRLAETMGRRPPASRYSMDMSKHYIFGDKQNPLLHNFNLEPLRSALFLIRTLN